MTAANPSAELNDLLGAYSAGRLDAPLQALVAAHLQMNPTSRPFVRELETMAADEAFAQDGVALSNRDERLHCIFDETERVVARPEADPLLPAPLRHFLGHGSEALRWRGLLPSLKEARIANHGLGGEVAFLKVRAGGRMPAHAHDGSEYTLILKGGYSDETGHYRAGDIAIAEVGSDHRPKADEDEECICFIVTDAPLRLTGPIGRLYERIFHAR